MHCLIQMHLRPVTSPWRPPAKSWRTWFLKGGSCYDTWPVMMLGHNTSHSLSQHIISFLFFFSTWLHHQSVDGIATDTSLLCFLLILLFLLLWCLCYSPTKLLRNHYHCLITTPSDPELPHCLTSPWSSCWSSSYPHLPSTLNTCLRLALIAPFRLAHHWPLLPQLPPVAQAQCLNRLQSSNIAHLVASMDSISLY